MDTFKTSNVTGRHRGPKRKLRAGYRIQSAITKINVISQAQHVICRDVFSWSNVCVQSSGIILIPEATFVPNFVSFAASNAELAHGEKIAYSLKSPSLFDAPGTEALPSKH